MGKLKKTNAMRILEQSGMAYEFHSYDKRDGKIDGVSVADKIGRPHDVVFKTLVARGTTGQLYVFVIPVTSELDLKKAAKASGEKKIQMIPVKEIQSQTGYIRGGCSPIGMKKHYPTFLDISAADLDRVVVSAGQIGMQVEIAPEDLLTVVGGRFDPLI